MDGPLRLLRDMRRGVQAVAYGNPVYRMLLEQTDVPDRLRVTLPDPWPGDAGAGQGLVNGPTDLFQGGPPSSGDRPGLAPTHEWLRHLRAVGTEPARRKALALLDAWLLDQDSWNEDGWAPEILGARIANWVAFHDFYNAGPPDPPDFTQRLLASLARQLRHLQRVMPARLTGVAHLAAVRGLLYGGLALGEDGRATGLALDLLQRQLRAEILPDGGVASRNPSAHLRLLQGLVEIRLALRAVGLDALAELGEAIGRMTPALKLFRHGDGGLALFNGSREESPLLIDSILTMAEARRRVLRRLPDTGFERLTAGRSLLLMDVGAPPPSPHDADAHAGLLAFEFSAGRERLIVNCGAGPEGDPEWRRATAATAAHSALALGDTNACDVLPDGGLGHCPREVGAQRYEQNGVQHVEAWHDGYARTFRTTCHRTLSLSEDGETLEGRELLTGPAGKPATLRWHLHPSLQAARVQDGRAVLLRTPSGAGWRLRAETGELALEPGVYCGGEAPRRAWHVRLAFRTQAPSTTLRWVLAREK